jgi:hypothetical protein
MLWSNVFQVLLSRFVCENREFVEEGDKASMRIYEHLQVSSIAWKQKGESWVKWPYQNYNISFSVILCSTWIQIVLCTTPYLKLRVKVSCSQTKLGRQRTTCVLTLKKGGFIFLKVCHTQVYSKLLLVNFHFYIDTQCSSTADKLEHVNQLNLAIAQLGRK